MESNALDDLAALWISAPNRDAVTAASRLIDAELSLDASTKGTEVAEGLRRFAAAPLRAFFTVDDGDRFVEVASVVRS
jgi:hypothetical protein